MQKIKKSKSKNVAKYVTKNLHNGQNIERVQNDSKIN